MTSIEEIRQTTAIVSRATRAPIAAALEAVLLRIEAQRAYQIRMADDEGLTLSDRDIVLFAGSLEDAILDAWHHAERATITTATTHRERAALDRETDRNAPHDGI